MAWLLVQNVVIAAMLAAVAAIVSRLRQVGPVARHALWLVVLIKLVTPPFLVLESPWSWPPASWLAEDPVVLRPAAETRQVRPLVLVVGRDAGYLRRVDPLPMIPRPSNSGTAAVVPSRAVAWPPLSASVAGIWIAGALGFLVVQIWRMRRMSRLVASGRAADATLLDAIDTARHRLQLAPIAVVVVPDAVSPLVWSVNPFRPLLVWPGHLTDATAACAGGLVTHELAHVKRRDHWVGWIELAAGTAWWWNPLFWFVRSRLRENAELACDAWVIESEPHGRRAYAEALLAVCAVAPSRTAPLPAVGVSTGSRRFLERRLAMIMQERVPVRLSRLALASLALMLAATLPVWAARIAGPDGQAVPPAPAAKPLPVVQTAKPDPGVPPSAIGAVPVQVKPSVTPVLVAPEAPKAFPFETFGPAEQLPQDARKLVQQFNDQQAALRKEMEAKQASQRDELVKQLKALQDTYTKAGSLDEAVAIRDQIRRLTQPGWSAWKYAPSDLSGWLAIEGDGVLRSDVMVSPPGQHSAKFEAFSAMFSDPLASALHSLRGQTGASLVVEVTGATGAGTHVWGTDVYTDDSSIAAAAVHAGLLKPGERGLLRVVILPGQDSYRGSDRNGLKSENFGHWEGSFRLERAGGR